jgi:hypothetical protein
VGAATLAVVNGMRLWPSTSERSQKMLEKEYQEAVAHNQIVVFVKDNDREQMISFSVDEE